MDKNQIHGTAIFTLLSMAVMIFSSATLVQCAVINLWPKPRIVSWPLPLATLLSPKFIITSPNHRYLSTAVYRYLHLILTEHHHPLVIPTVNLTNGSVVQSLIVTIHDLSAPLVHGVNESYHLKIPSTGVEASLTAETAWGAMRGLETFSQLVWGNPSHVASGMEVWDWPIFEHRGVMLDTSRNFYNVEDILRMIGAMSGNKLNVFHWHITDSHSFPLLLPSEPGLADKGSYGPDMQYSPKDVTRIVQFGLEHGVRVLPEIDMPGDEVAPGCWKADPEIQEFLSKDGSLSEILEMFLNSTFPYIVSMNRTVVYWEDVLLDQTVRVNRSLLPPESTILQTWNDGPNNTKAIVSSGYRAIVSSADYYYLDCGHGSFIGNNSKYDQGNAGNTGTGDSCLSFTYVHRGGFQLVVGGTAKPSSSKSSQRRGIDFPSPSVSVFPFLEVVSSSLRPL
ncbi:hypothetical protein CRG98_020453 [Punica granatum]|uniref:beta-N-acetylhexosaminidase n=1 Tax=Punica granatum TaxID=22663 RepID=A0A2I0JRZ6_PUNGR|nr:hypothetical protein CRG98_020453 [Punica granatum]